MIKRFVFLALCIFLVLVSTNAIYADQINLSKLEEVSVTSTESQINVTWNDAKQQVEYYQIVDDFGKELYRGKSPNFTISDINSDSYISIYLVGFSDNIQVTEKVAITAKTKRNDGGEERSFSSIITKKDSVMLNWDKVENLIGAYKVQRNGEFILQTGTPSFQDHNLVPGTLYSYSIDITVASLDKDIEGNTVDKKFTYQTTVNTANASNNLVVTPLSLTDSYYPTILFETFIPAAEVYDPQNNIWFLDPCDSTTISMFNGNNRSFQYNSSSYKTRQEVSIDFYNKEYSYNHNAGQTHGWCKKKSDGTKVPGSDRYGTDAMTYSYITNVSFNGDVSVSLKLYLSSYNPLVWSAPAIDADLALTVYRGGGTTTGITYYSILHDGFPNYELYRKDGSLPYKTLYTYSSAGKTPYDLFPPYSQGGHGTY